MTQVYPVIHYKDDSTTISQAILAKTLNADGVFLISHIGNNEKLIPLAIEIKKLFPNFQVGLNFLGETALHTAKIVKENNLDMIWADSCGVSSQGLNEEGQELKDWASNNQEINVFASVAFKYQRNESNPPLAANEAQNAGFIATTSGAGTGQAPSVNKIRDMSLATNGQLAIASGMTCENIEEFVPYLSHILVATGVSKDDYHFDVDKLTTFIRLVKSN